MLWCLTREVPIVTSRRLCMEAITSPGKYFFTDLNCYSTWSCGRLSDKLYGPSDITHQSQSCHSHACTTAVSVKVYGLDTWKQAWTGEACITGEQHPLWKWTTPQLCLLIWKRNIKREISKSTCITQELQSHFQHEINMANQCGWGPA